MTVYVLFLMMFSVHCDYLINTLWKWQSVIWLLILFPFPKIVIIKYEPNRKRLAWEYLMSYQHHLGTTMEIKVCPFLCYPWCWCTCRGSCSRVSEILSFTSCCYIYYQVCTLCQNKSYLMYSVVVIMFICYTLLLGF